MNIYQQILVKYWGYTEFRPLQDDIIKSVAAGHDTLGLMPTGAGKSVTFQVPALAKEGMCLVITPLIALMKDQVKRLNDMGIKAMAVHSGMTRDEIDTGLDNAIFGKFKFLYISPERIGTNLFQARLENMIINLIAVDEAHCISQWGYDFRPSYLEIARLKDHIPDVPLLALTATATPDVVDDIQDKLRFREKNVLRTSFERKNLVYSVLESEDKAGSLADIIHSVNGPGIVYVRSRKKTRELARILSQEKVSCDYYHAGLEHPERNRKQNDWMEEKFTVIIATNAFGMGIDKANVRYVIHYDLPDSLESYFQEAGRAGRDGNKAYAILLFNNTDRAAMDKRIAVNFPEIKVIKKTYQALGNYFQIPVGAAKGQSFDFNIAEFASRYRMNIITVFSCLKFLQREGYIEFTEEIYHPSRIMFLVARDDLYKFQVSNPDFDVFIKLLLRSYSGVFSAYTTINERLLAKKAKTDPGVIRRYLNRLNNMGIIRFIPQKKNPVIIYTEERLNNDSLMITSRNYKSLKKRFIRRTEQVLQYSTGKNVCRSRYLLNYFGESDTKRCGKCDICRKKNALDLNQYEFSRIRNKIKDILKENKLNVKELTSRLCVNDKGEEKEKALGVIRWLMENGRITEGEDLNLWWTEP